MKPAKNGLQSPAPKTFSRINLRNKKSLEQVQICIGVPSHPMAHERRYASYILNTLLGGGMSSRLFQNIRERQGLAYSIYSDLNPYRDTGSMCVYAGTSRESAIKVVECVVEEFRNLKTTPVPEEELRRSKDQLKGSLMLSLESSTARMSNPVSYTHLKSRFPAPRTRLPDSTRARRLQPDFACLHAPCRAAQCPS